MAKSGHTGSAHRFTLSQRKFVDSWSTEIKETCFLKKKLIKLSNFFIIFWIFCFGRLNSAVQFFSLWSSSPSKADAKRIIKIIKDKDFVLDVVFSSLIKLFREMMVKVLLSLDDYLQSFFIVFLGLEQKQNTERRWTTELWRHPKFSIVEVKETLTLEPEIGCL